ncbi:MAG: cysteine desulfurase [Bacteroidetes bacterium SB0662_bin_6]|nr:cysteine desulfurase [Bacteroidetes bacterium SB0668_bin_1]MYE03927.1 cysteine desulfurase [Bacteroidetes bacterium SB0662_bin_6]
MNPVYLDHAATTPLDARVIEAMQPFFGEHFGNASSVHALGRKARFAVEECREKVAALLGAEPGEIVFTSGGTESNNMALGAASGDVLTCAAEHESVLRSAEALQSSGKTVHMLKPGRFGAVSMEDIARGLDSEACAGVTLVSIMHANNETGALSPVRQIAEACRARGLTFHCDAVQTVGYAMIPEADMMTLSGHKFYGPKGIGALFVRAGIDVGPVLLGGRQERGRRAGTENVAAIAGFAKALKLAFDEGESRKRHAEAMRERLRNGIQAVAGERVRIVTPCDTGEAAPHILGVVAPPVNGYSMDGEMLLLNMDMENICVSAGSACTSGALEPSHVLIAMGLDRAAAAAFLRFSVGRSTTDEDVDRAVEAFDRVLRRMIRMPETP